MQKDVLIAFFGEDSQRYYRLVKTKDWPFLDISGIRMHCVDIGVKKAATEMVASLLPLKGKVLDCCAGLGYAATLLAQQPSVEKVYCFEKDSSVLEIAKQNEFSKELFSNKKIVLENKDILSETKNFSSNFFDAVLLDPPSFSISGELYSRTFYSELYRVLKRTGKLFHYTGAPGQKKGANFLENTMKRLKETGFKNIVTLQSIKGIIAEK